MVCILFGVRLIASSTGVDTSSMFEFLLFVFCEHFDCDLMTQVTRAGFQARTALLNAIYEKSLRLRPTDKQASTTGQTVNLMANDTNRIFDCFLLINFLWYVCSLLCCSTCGLFRALFIK